MFIRNTMLRLFRSPDAADGGGAGDGAASLGAGEATPEADSAQPDVPAQGDKAPKESAPPSAPTREADDDAYARIIAKAEKNDGYQMTDAEAEIFARVSDRDEEPKPRAKKAPEDGDSPDVDETTEDLGEIPEGMEEFVGAKSPFGAKTAAELPAKLKEFTAKFKEMQGRDGLSGRLEQRIDKQTAFIRDFIAGAPEAIKFATEKLGYKKDGGFAPEAPRPEGRRGAEKPIYLDDEMAAYVATLEEKVQGAEARLQKVESRYAQAEEMESKVQAQGDVINEMSVLAEKYPELSIKNGSLRELAKQYMQNPILDKVDPRFKPMAQILHIAADKGLPNLEAAFALWRLESMPQTVAEAERRGRESLAKNTPSRGLSDRQGSQGGQYTAYTDADLSRMSRGEMEIPDEWADANGNLIMTKLPKRLRDQFQGQLNEAE